MYKKVNSDLGFVAREKAIKEFWIANHIFQKSMEKPAAAGSYVFYDGPPTANGKPHIGHVLTRAIKDMIPRYRTMKGYFVPRKAGWDTHGLPVELEVEKALGLDGKEQIEKYGLEPFIKKCKESVWQYKGMWEDFSETVGFWADMEHPYVTYHNDFIESEWWALKEIYNKGLLYKGFKIVPYCPHCGTPLSSHEVAQGYKLVKERSAIVRFKIRDRENEYFLAWTTTPWTLPSNVALCVHPEAIYDKVKAADGRIYIMADALLDTVLGSLGDPAYEVLETYTGKDLEGMAYEPLFACAGEAAAKQGKKAHFVTCDTYVTMSDGTGIVHIAPAFGEDDSRVGRNYDLPFVQFVDAKGLMTAETPYAGLFVKDADPEVLKDLDAQGKLFAAPKFEHDYPHCWRCKSPLIYYARETWFIRMTEMRDRLIANNDTINWFPENVGKGRFGDWLRNVQDWGISRNRYWGTPLNIWECACGKRHCVGSIAELKSMSKNCPDDIELHRPYIDSVTLTCPDCGGEMHRVPEVIDCWFDSGSMPFAQHHYPFENKDLFEQQFPADFISEAVDQTRGWFYSLLAISTLLFDKAPFRNVIVLGLVLDENGEKMSKSKGNAVDPFTALDKLGADAIRWYFYTNSQPWLPNKFHDKVVIEGQRKFMNTLWNTYAFYVLYAEIHQFDPTKYTLDTASLSVMDKWLLSRMNTMIRTADENLNGYRIPEAAKAMQDFVDELSNWYVRRGRERFWNEEMTQDTINAYMTLYTALDAVCRCAAPMIPFITEEIYQNIVRSVDASAPESIHLCDYPTADASMIDADLEATMAEAMEIVALGRAARNASSRKNRQPLRVMYVKAERKLDDSFVTVIREELNLKNVTFTDGLSDFMTYTFKPQMRTLGPKYGKQLGEIREALTKLDGNAAMASLEETGTLTLTLSTGDISLTKDDLLIDTAQQEGFTVIAEQGVTVALDTTLTPELEAEGLVREVVSKLQNMRKDSGFEVMDRINVTFTASEKLTALLTENASSICADVLADTLTPAASTDGKTWDLGDESITIKVERV